KLFDDVGEKFAALVAMLMGRGSKKADDAVEAAEDAVDAATDGAKGADGAVPPGKGGGGGGGGTPPKGGGGEGDAVKTSKEAYARAKDLRKALQEKVAYKDKTPASDHVRTLSGWSKTRRPPGYQDPNVDEVLEKCKEIGHEPKPHRRNDNGIEGQYNASHAEKQLSLTAKEPYIGVGKPCCSDCQAYFSKLAQHEGRDWYVTDPKKTWIFRADGSIEYK
ncbi:hypothetical protein, partial [Actinomyces viscosus]